MTYAESGATVFPAGWELPTKTLLANTVPETQSDLTDVIVERTFDDFDSAFDVVGVYDNGNRVDGQGPQHAFNW